MSFNTKSIYWLAGILEGEGWFGLSRTTPIISIASIDEDIVKRVSMIILGHPIVGRHSQKHTKRYGWKSQYLCRPTGRIAIEWMMTLYPIMSRRRKEDIKEIIDKWKILHIKCRRGHDMLSPGSFYYDKKNCRSCTECTRIRRNKIGYWRMVNGNYNRE